MEPRVRETVAERVEQLDGLDRVSEPLQNVVRAAVPAPSRRKDVLSGTWLGHPLHPPLTDVVIGAWTAALLLDLGGGERTEEAADRLVAAGVLAAVPTAAAGLADWAELRGADRRVGSLHAAGNAIAVLLHALSWASRRGGKRRRGVALSALGYGVATFSAWLGGHLSFGRGSASTRRPSCRRRASGRPCSSRASSRTGRWSGRRPRACRCCSCERAVGCTRSRTAVPTAAARSTRGSCRGRP